MPTNDVTATHADYDRALPKWTKAEDAAAGEDDVKAKKDIYLPRPNPKDTTPENQSRFDQYLFRAVYYNATGRTLNALVGLAYDQDPELELPTDIGYLEQDVTGSGITLLQHSQATLAAILKTGRGGLLADFPRVLGPVSKADQQNGGVRANTSFYAASAITNWRTTKVAGETVLSLVVLAETHETPNAFAMSSEPQFRALWLRAGVYTVEIWRKRVKADTKQEEWYIDATYVPLRGNGTPWDEIPFSFVGAQNNDWNVDGAPLYDIAVLNLAHYRNSADYEDSAYIVGQPQVWMSGVDEGWVKILKDMGIYFGSRAILPLPVNGSAGLLQADPNTMAREAMKSKEEQMAALGARLLLAGGVIKTATQSDSDDIVAHSVLSLAVENVSASYRKALTWCQIFENGGDSGVEFAISNEFTKITLDPQMLAQILAGVQSGQIPVVALWAKLRKVGWIPADMTDEQIQEAIDSQPPPANGGALDEGSGTGAKPGDAAAA